MRSDQAAKGIARDGGQAACKARQPQTAPAITFAFKPAFAEPSKFPTYSGSAGLNFTATGRFADLYKKIFGEWIFRLC